MSRNLLLGAFALAIAACGTTREAPKANSDETKDIQPGKFPHQVWDRVLKKYNKAGFVDYVGLSKDRKDLDLYLNALSRISPKNNPKIFPDKKHELAYWINAYNALVFQGVLARMPDIKSVYDDINAFFGIVVGGDTYKLGGEQYTLKALEDKTIREGYQDPRIHFGLNCASFSCPRLPEEAFVPERLDEQLDRESKNFFNEERNVNTKEEKGKLVLTKICDWFQSDFTDYPKQPSVVKAQSKEDKVVAYINLFRAADQQIPTGLEVKYREYDWSLNKQVAKK